MARSSTAHLHIPSRASGYASERIRSKLNGQLASLIQRRAGGGHRDVSTQRTRSRGGARRPATTPPPVGAGRRAAGTSIERQHGNTSGFCAFCRLCFRAAARSMPRAARPPAGDACHFSPRDSAPQRPLREIVSALSAIFASDDTVIYVSLLSPVSFGALRAPRPLRRILSGRPEMVF